AAEPDCLTFLDAGGNLDIDFPAVNAKRNGPTEGGSLQRDGHLGDSRRRRLLALARTAAAAGTSHPPNAAQSAQITKKVAEQGFRLFRVHLLKTRAAAPVKGWPPSAARKTAIGAGKAEAVVLGALALVAQYIISVLDFLEARFGLLVPRI